MPDPDVSLYQMLLESVGDAIIALDGNGNIVVWNPAAEALYGWTKAEVLGRPPSQFLGTKYDDPYETSERARETVMREGVWRGKVTQNRKDGTRVTVESTVRPYQISAQEGNGLVAVNRDISENERLRSTINRLEYLNRVLIRQPTLDEAFRIYVGQIKEIIQIDQVDLWLIDGGEVQVSRRFAQNQFEFSVDERCLLKDTVLGLVRLTRQALIVDDLRERSNLKQKGLLHSEGRALMVLPMILNSEVVGGIVFLSHSKGVYQLEHANLLIPATEQLCIALNQIRLLHSIQNKADENARLLAASQKKTEQLQEMSKALIRLQERERAQLAREFHDEIGQSLTAIYLNLRSMLAECENWKPEVVTELNESLEITSRLMEQVRSISLVMYPKILEDLGFIPALRWLVNRTGKLANAKVHLALVESYEPLGKTHEFEIFRIAQEALTNILRHAHAGNIFVHLSQDDNRTTLVLSDDGDGFLADFHTSAQLPAEVFGLYSMFARAELIGAEIHVSSTPGKGTTVKVVCRHENKA